MLYKKDLIMVLYVDDAGIAAPTKDIVNKFVEDLRAHGFDLEIEGDFTEYLGIKIEELSDGSRVMSQAGLIQKVIEYVGLQDCIPNYVPAALKTLGSDPEGELFSNKEWNYASAVGMLQYLSNNTRPDITFAVSQVARFTSAPKESHATAVKMIIRYLKKTEKKGLIVKPTGSLNIKVWCDADYAGLHRSEPDASPDSAKSRLGFIITVGDVPLVWKSQLIHEICLSTTMSEYASLTTAICTLVPIHRMLNHLLEHLQLPDTEVTFSCKVFEDNAACFSLATNQRITQRTRYFNVKWHFFWTQVKGSRTASADAWIEIEQCPTKLMRANMLTKPLPRETFERHRNAIQGW
jgi:hypothetical protein